MKQKITHFGTFLIFEKNCHFSPFFALFFHFFFHVYVVKLKVYYIKVFYKRDFIVQFLWSKKSLIWGLSMVFRMAKHKVYPASFTYLLLLIKGSEFSIIWTSCSTNQPSKPSKPWNHVPNTGLFWYMAWNPLPNTLYYGHVSEKRLPTSNFQKNPSVCSGYVVINRGDPFDFNWSADADWCSVKNHKCYVVEHIFYTLATDADECTS